MKQSTVILRGSIQGLTHFKSNSCHSVYLVLCYWLITVNSCQGDHRWWSDFWPLNGPSFRAAPPCSPPVRRLAVLHCHVSTDWQYGGRVQLGRWSCYPSCAYNREDIIALLTVERRYDLLKKDPSPCDLKMARLADYFVVVGYDLEKRGGCSC